MLLSVFVCINFANRAPMESADGPADCATVLSEVVRNKKEKTIKQYLIRKLYLIIDFKIKKSTNEGNKFRLLIGVLKLSVLLPGISMRSPHDELVVRTRQVSVPGQVDFRNIH